MATNQPNSALQATVETLRTAAKRLRLGVEGQRTADDLEAIADSMEAARALTAAQRVDDLDHAVARDLVGEAIGFEFEPGEIQPVNEHDLMEIINALLGYRATLSQPTEPQGAVVELAVRAHADFLEKHKGAWVTDSEIAVGAMRAALKAALPVAVGAGEDSKVRELVRLIRELRTPFYRRDHFIHQEATSRCGCNACVDARCDEAIAAMTPATPAGKGTDHA